MISISQLHKLFSETGIASTDSRNCPKGCLFFALKGESFDGNKFASSALENGAGYAIVDNNDFVLSDKYLLVDNVLSTLQQLATYHRNRFMIPVIGITGTNGKTTTKELIASVLQTSYSTHYTKGNFNNHIGVPLTLLQLNDTHEIAIIEMGANHQGEINTLCEIAQPTHGIITNVGKAHLEGFGSFEGVVKTKTELYRFIKAHQGTIFVNTDNQYLSPLSQGLTRISFSKNGFSTLQTKILSDLPYLKIRISSKVSSFNISSNLTGRYNYENILSALTIGDYFKIPVNLLKKGIENYIPSNNRSQVKETGKNTLLLDAYNANPSSMEVALSNLKQQKHPRKIAVLGDMKELGDYSIEEHLKIAKLALNSNFTEIWLIGEEFYKISDSLKHEKRVSFFKATEDILSSLHNSLIKDSLILIKGSRSMKLEQLESYF